MPTYLALDVGEARIGVAIGSSEGRIARPLQVLRSRGTERDAAAIAALARDHGANALVAGLPVQPDGGSGTHAERVRRYVGGLAAALGLPVHFVDERLSTQDAQQLLLESGRRRARRRQLEDAAAAAVILQHYLDRLPPEEALP